MKNIHVLPTDKPSRLRYNLSNVLALTKEPYRDYSKQVNQNICITNDEEIKEGDWVYSIWDKKIKRAIKDIKDALFLKKVILTTDQDLIKDGVQAIDDEFLEWFIKNPSCEKVNIEKDYSYGNLEHFDYKIIIPKEEPKQECLITKSIQLDAELAYKSLPKQEPKQETTSEGFHRIYKETDYREFDFVSFKIGVEWQQERSYSEEDLREAFRQGQDNMDYSEIYGWDSKLTEQEWFEQFKKK